MAGDNLIEVGPQITPAVIIGALTDEIDQCWRIKSVFSPGLDYVEAGENHNSDHLAENDLSAIGTHPLIDSIFAWNRSHIQSNSQLGDFTGVLTRYCQENETLDDTAPGEFTLNFRAFFSDAQTMEIFEMGYLTGKVLRNINTIVAYRCDLDGNQTSFAESYSLEWNPIEGIDWSLRENNYMSLDFSVRIEGTFRCSMPVGDACLPKEILKFHFNTLTE